MQFTIWLVAGVAVVALVLAGLALFVALAALRVGRFARERTEEHLREIAEQPPDAPKWECEIQAAHGIGNGYTFILRHLDGAAPVEAALELVDAAPHVGFVSDEGQATPVFRMMDYGIVSDGAVERRRFVIDGIRPVKLTGMVYSAKAGKTWYAPVVVKLPDWGDVWRASSEHG